MSTTQAAICEAIKARNVIQFYYEGGQRIVEPFLIGIHEGTGNVLLRAWQVGGYSESNRGLPWRLYEVDHIENLTVLNQAANSSRNGYNPNDKAMSRILCRV